jgi:drug/metabolite transporter (DMT)-like permease
MTSTEIGLVLLSALLHASWNTATKGSDSPTAFMLGMEVIILFVVLPLLPLIDYAAIPWELWGVLVGTGLTHTLYAFWLSRAYTHADLSLVYPIARSTPAFVPLVAIPLLGESVSLAGAIGIALVVAGMWAVQSNGRLRTADLLSLGALFAWLTLATTVAYSLLDKRGMQLLHAAEWSSPLPRAVAYMVLLYVAYVPLFALLGLRSVGWREVARVLRGGGLGVAGAAVVGLTSYVVILQAFQTAPVSYVVAVRQSSVLFAVALGAIFLHERPGRVRLLGAAGTVAGVGLIALYS